MTPPHSGPSALLIAVLLPGTATLVGCAAALPAVKFDPRQGEPASGGMFGRLEITNGGEAVTEDCFVHFSDEQEQEKAHLDLDASGWVFSHVTPGQTYLSEVRCVLGSIFTSVASYRTRSVHFEVESGDQITYFGHLKIELDTSSAPAIVGSLIGGLVGSLIATSNAAGDDQSLAVKNEVGAATHEFRTRFGARARGWRVIDGVGGLRDPAPGSVPRDRALMVAHVYLGGVKLMWLGRPRTHPDLIGLRFERYVAKADVDSCRELELTLDGVTTRHALTYDAKPSSGVLRESLQAVTDVDTARAILAAGSVGFNLCGLQRTLSVQATERARVFLASFEERVPKATEPSASAADSEVQAAPNSGNHAQPIELMPNPGDAGAAPQTSSAKAVGPAGSAQATETQSKVIEAP